MSNAELWASANTLDVDGRPVLVPSSTDAATLLVAHAQLHDLTHRFRRLPLRALYDLATLDRAGRWSAVDWELVERRFTRVHERRALGSLATAAQVWFGSSLPVDRTGGRRWTAAARRALDRPRAADRRRRLAMVPLTFGAARMDRLYDTSGPVGRQWARARHLVQGVARRLRRPSRGGGIGPGARPQGRSLQRKST